MHRGKEGCCYSDYKKKCIYETNFKCMCMFGSIPKQLRKRSRLVPHKSKLPVVNIVIELLSTTQFVWRSTRSPAALDTRHGQTNTTEAERAHLNVFLITLQHTVAGMEAVLLRTTIGCCPKCNGVGTLRRLHNSIAAYMMTKTVMLDDKVMDA